MDQTYQCKGCDFNGPITGFYTWKTKAGVVKPLPKCKTCHNAGKYQKKAKGWAKLAPEVQAKLREMLSDRRTRMTTIAKEVGVSYASLKGWVARGDHLTNAQTESESEESDNELNMGV